MSVADDCMAEIKATFGDVKTYVVNTVAAKDAEIAAHLKTIQDKEAAIADAQKKLEDHVASAVSPEAFKAFSDELVAEMKGAMA